MVCLSDLEENLQGSKTSSMCRGLKLVLSKERRKGMSLLPEKNYLLDTLDQRKSRSVRQRDLHHVSVIDRILCFPLSRSHDIEVDNLVNEKRPSTLSKTLYTF